MCPELFFCFSSQSGALYTPLLSPALPSYPAPTHSPLKLLATSTLPFPLSTPPPWKRCVCVRSFFLFLAEFVFPGGREVWRGCFRVYAHHYSSNYIRLYDTIVPVYYHMCVNMWTHDRWTGAYITMSTPGLLMESADGEFEYHDCWCVGGWSGKWTCAVSDRGAEGTTPLPLSTSRTAFERYVNGHCGSDGD